MNTFLKNVIEQNPVLTHAYALAKKAHHGEKRKNGEAYLNHCLATARIVHQWKLDEVAVAAALLHDAPKRPGITLETIAKETSEEVAFLVGRIMKVGQVRYNGLNRNVEHIRHLTLYVAEDVRALLVRLASRLHNMQSLYVFPDTGRRRIALETMDVYAPIAYQLGMYKVRAELEDLALPYVYPKEHEWLMTHVRERREDIEKHTAGLIPHMRSALAEYRVPVHAIEARAKHYMSLYRKLLRSEMDLEKVHDVVALRIITETISDCYAALGVVHRIWAPVSGRFKDYIAAPKTNGYRSIHTTVRTHENQSTEVQIRTRDMHEEAELGIAAHWGYASSKGTKAYLARQSVRADEAELAIMRQLREWRGQFLTTGEGSTTFLANLFEDKVLVLTPKSDVIELPKGATPVDFSYKIHSGVGDHAVGAKVNGVMVSLDYTLHSGDVVEILTQKNKQPSASWLRFVKTAHARHHVNAALKKMKSMFGAGRAAKEQGTEVEVTLAEGPSGLKIIEHSFRTLRIPVRAMRVESARWFGKHSLCVVSCHALSKDERERITRELVRAPAVKKVAFKSVRQG